MKPKRTVRLRHDVQDKDKTAIYGKKRRFRADKGNVYLVGMRASGKTTLGRLLAEHMDHEFVDTDRLVEQEAGTSIDELVKAQGWDAFRNLESDILRRVGERQGLVVATGGGIVLRPENSRILRATGKVFYLMADPGELVERLRKDPNEAQRPALTDLDLDREMAVTLSDRDPMYLAVADFILQAGESPEELLRSALEKMCL
jgi:shikimate kinase